MEKREQDVGHKIPYVSSDNVSQNDSVLQNDNVSRNNTVLQNDSVS